MDQPSTISLDDLETITGGVQFGPTIRAIALGAGLLLGPEKIETIEAPRQVPVITTTSTPPKR